MDVEVNIPEMQPVDEETLEKVLKEAEVDETSTIRLKVLLMSYGDLWIGNPRGETNLETHKDLTNDIGKIIELISRRIETLSVTTLITSIAITSALVYGLYATHQRSYNTSSLCSPFCPFLSRFSSV